MRRVSTDEMNAHVPQSLPALAEAEILMRAEAHIVSGQSNAPVNGIVQDGLNSSYILTNTWEDVNNPYTMIPIEIFKECLEGAEISEERCTNMLIRAAVLYPEYISINKNGLPVFKKKKIPGKIMLSVLFPSNLNYERKTDTNVNFPIVKIENGIIKPDSGPLCKKVIGSKANSIIHLLWIEYSPEVTLRFLSDCQQVTDRWFPNYGFSMGIHDCMATSDDEISRTLIEMKIKIGAILEKCNGVPGPSEELDINIILNSAMNIGLKISKTSMFGGDKNALNIMRNAGAKGSLVNLIQIVAFVGQQNIGGHRIPLSLTQKTRSLPHFNPNDNTAEARGFVSNGYLNGLTPAEVFFHAAAGRTGIISTSIKSVTYDTLIFIIENEVPKTIKIGEWIDFHLVKKYKNIQKFEELEMEYLDLEENVFIPTVDDNGTVTWEYVTAVTRHLPTEFLYKITTKCGREVTVAESKSLVVWNEKTQKLEQKHMLDVTLFDKLPITRFLPLPPTEIEYFNLPSHPIENPRGIKKFICNRINGYFLGALIATCCFDSQTEFRFSIKPKYNYCKDTILKLCSVFETLKLQVVCKEEIYITSCILSTFIEGFSNNLNSIVCTSLEFKEGVLDGYFSFGGFVCEKDGLMIKDFENPIIPEYLIINMLCNNFGIICHQTELNCFQIEKIHLYTFMNNIFITNTVLRNDIHSYIKVNTMNYIENFFNDVYLDPIEKIEKIVANTENKLYDLTIPSTLNFCLANGLHVADTSDTGYIQKKIGRKIEDCRAYIDGSIRTNNGKIIQFLYGDDGMNPKFLYIPKNLDFPFFVNPINIAKRLNSDAVQQHRVTKKDVPRMLYEPEINLLLSFIISGQPYLKSEIIELQTFNVRTILRNLLEQPSTVIYECMIPLFCSEIKNMYETAKVQYGEMVGLHTASFIGEPVTQMTLDAFHNTGVKGKDISLGVPRFNELLNATKSNKQKKISQVIHFNLPELSENTDKIKKLTEEKKNVKDESKRLEIDNLIKDIKSSSISFLEKIKKNYEETSVGYFVKEFDMQYLSNDVNPDINMSPLKILTYEEYEKKWWVSLREELFGPLAFEPEHWVIVLYFDMEKMFNKDISLEDIAIIIEENSENKYYCVPSPNALGTIEVYCNFSVIKDYVRNGIKLPPNEIEEKTLLTEENINFFVCRDVTINYICNIRLTGIFGIKKVYPREIPETGKWVLDVECREIQSKISNIRFLESLTSEGVDPYNTDIDDMHTIFAILGIEAARKFLIEEFTRIISFDGVYINPRHIQLLADSMTYTGEITSVRRDGISRDVGPNAKIMFEQAVDNAVEASAFSELDNMLGVSSSIMYGLTSKVGTGVVEIKPVDKIPVKTVAIKDKVNILDLEEVQDGDEPSDLNNDDIVVSKKKETPNEKRKRIMGTNGSQRKNIIRKK